METPSFSIACDHDREIVRVKVLSDLTKEIGEAIITQARTRAAERSYDILYDVRSIRLKVSSADWFYLPRKLDVLKAPQTRNLRVALLTSPENQKDYLFYENVTHNMGLSVRVFLEEEDALAWLGNKA